MATNYKHRFTQRAAGDVIEIMDYLTKELSNPAAASAFRKRLRACVETLCLFPKSGSAVGNSYIPNPDVRKKLIGNYILFYQHDDANKMIYVLRVVHGSRDQDAVLQNLNN